MCIGFRLELKLFFIEVLYYYIKKWFLIIYIQAEVYEVLFK